MFRGVTFSLFTAVLCWQTPVLAESAVDHAALFGPRQGFVGDVRAGSMTRPTNYDVSDAIRQAQNPLKARAQALIEDALEKAGKREFLFRQAEIHQALDDVKKFAGALVEGVFFEVLGQADLSDKLKAEFHTHFFKWNLKNNDAGGSVASRVLGGVAERIQGTVLNSRQGPSE